MSVGVRQAEIEMIVTIRASRVMRKQRWRQYADEQGGVGKEE
jgi:hypothetical protein